MTNEIKQKIEQINNGEVPEGYTHKYHIKPDLWMDEPLDAFFYKVKEKNSEKKYNTVFTNSAINGVIPQSQYFEKDIANEENIDGYYIVRAGDYIYNPRISEKAPYGPIKRNLTGCTGIASPLYTVFSKKENVCICDDYIRYYLDSAEWNKYIYSVANYGARFDRMNISDSDFMNMPIALPPFAEQQKIAEILMQCDKLIELYQREVDELQKLKKICLHKMFPKKSENVPEWRLPGFTEPWEQRKLGELGAITTGNTPSTSVSEYYSDDGMIWVTPTDIADNITYETEKKLSILGQQVGRVVPKNTILVTCIASIGKNTMLGKSGSFNQQINGLTPNEKKYVPYFLFTESALWSAQMKKSAAAGTMQIVNRTEFSELKTWIPTYDEQKKIGAYFENLDRLITLHQRKVEEMKRQKKSLMQLLLTGIVRVKL